jgi:hypothetical protein
VRDGPSLRRIPWDRALLVLLAGLVSAWSAGFVAGLIVRAVSGLW